MGGVGRTRDARERDLPVLRVVASEHSEHLGTVRQSANLAAVVSMAWVPVGRL